MLLVIYIFSLDSFSIFNLGYLSFYYWVIRIPYMFWIQIPVYVYAQSLSWVRVFATLWTVAHQAPLSMGFSWHEYWSGLPLPASGDLPNPETELCFLHCQADSSPLNHLGRLIKWQVFSSIL